MADGAAAGGFPVRMVAVEGRGRGLFASRDIAAGETVMQEAPNVLIAAPEYLPVVCAQCLRGLAGHPGLACETCGRARFCSAECLQQAQQPAGNHSPVVCRCLAAGEPQGASSDELAQLHYLYHALALKLAAPVDPGAAAAYQGLLSVVGEITPGTEPPLKLHQALCVAAGAAGVQPSPPMTLEEVAVLLKKDELNSYGIMAPSAAGGERRIRGSGLYVYASLVNHECLPNVARFDNFDSAGPQNTAITLRALHAIPAGSEVLQSYFPLNWSYGERQERCKEQYGFVCRCPRCTLESKYDDDSDEEDESGGDEMGDEPDGPQHQAGGSSIASEADVKGKGAMVLPSSEGQEGDHGVMDEEDDVQDTYQYLFLEKHICPQEDCFGTMAPVAPGADVLECNMCGHRRTEAEFMAELDLRQRAGTDDEDDDLSEDMD